MPIPRKDDGTAKRKTRASLLVTTTTMKRQVKKRSGTVRKKTALASEAEGTHGKHQPAVDASMLHIRIANTLKAQASKTLEEIGLTTSEAVRLFLHRVVVEQRLPLDLRIPNAETRAAIIEARKTAQRSSRFATPEAMFESLENAK